MARSVGWREGQKHALFSRPLQRVLMAGSDVAPEFAGWIAGAIASGRQVATEASQLLAES